MTLISTVNVPFHILVDLLTARRTSKPLDRENVSLYEYNNVEILVLLKKKKKKSRELNAVDGVCTGVQARPTTTYSVCWGAFS